MLDVIESLVNIVVTLVSFVINTIEGLISLIIRIPGYITMLIETLNILPTFLLPYMVAFISIVVVQYILNRRAS